MTDRQEDTETVFSGTVAWFSLERGHGFIHVGDIDDCTGKPCPGCIFVHFSGLVRGRVKEKSGRLTLFEGEEVSYEIGQNHRGTCAVNVQVTGFNRF